MMHDSHPILLVQGLYDPFKEVMCQYISLDHVLLVEDGGNLK